MFPCVKCIPNISAAHQTLTAFRAVTWTILSYTNNKNETNKYHLPVSLFSAGHCLTSEFNADYRKSQVLWTLSSHTHTVLPVKFKIKKWLLCKDHIQGTLRKA